MLGNMMNNQLLISGVIEHAEKYHSDAEIVSRTVEGPIHRYTYSDAAKRSRKLANALVNLGLKEGDTIGTSNWLATIYESKPPYQLQKFPPIIVPDLSTCSKLFIASSIELKKQTEGTPTVIMEAMAAGLPVIATNVGGVSEAIDHELNGIICEPKSDELLTAFKNFINNKNLYKDMGRNGYNTLIESFSMATMTKKLENYFQSFIK